jgi:hypothetical protein
MEERKYLSRLILYVREATGRTFDQQIATLLMDAFEANGQNRKFSPDQIKKHRQRYVPSSRARNSSS